MFLPSFCLLASYPVTRFRSVIRVPSVISFVGSLRTRSPVLGLLYVFPPSSLCLLSLYTFTLFRSYSCSLRLLFVCSLRTRSPSFRSATHVRYTCLLCVCSICSLRTRSPGFRSATHVRYTCLLYVCSICTRSSVLGLLRVPSVFSLFARFVRIHQVLGLLNMFPTDVSSLFSRFVHVHQVLGLLYLFPPSSLCLLASYTFTRF